MVNPSRRAPLRILGVGHGGEINHCPLPAMVTFDPVEAPVLRGSWKDEAVWPGKENRPAR